TCARQRLLWGSPTEASVQVPVLRPVDDFPRRNRLSRFALTLWRAGPRFDRPPPLQRPSRRRVRTSFWLSCPPPDARAPHGHAAIGVAACPRPRDEREWRKDSQKKFFILPNP